MNSIAAFQMVKALDEERLRHAESRRLAAQRRSSTQERGSRLTSGGWRAVLRFPHFTAAASKG